MFVRERSLALRKTMIRALPICLLALVVVFVADFTSSGALAAADEADDTASPLIVGVKHAPPFVTVDESSGVVTGFSIDLIRLIAAQMEPPREIKFQVHRDFKEHLGAVQSGQVDLGIAATSFTSERLRVMDFSLPFYQSGLDIAVREEGAGVKVWDIVTSRKLGFAVLWLAIFLVVCAHVIWFTERGKSEAFDDRWLQGVGQSLWWTIVTMTTVGYGDFVPRKPLSRFLGVLVIMAGIVLFGVSVGAFSSALTVQKLASDIRGPDDLRGRSVAVVRGTIAEEVMRRRGAEVLPVKSLDEALAEVDSGEVTAAVHDQALLQHHLSQEAYPLALVGRPFSKQFYGITFPAGSELRKQVNVAILELVEGDPPLYRQLVERWFGAG
jgi:ABC-type amino acid transport substrate-binding protein